MRVDESPSSLRVEDPVTVASGAARPWPACCISGAAVNLLPEADIGWLSIVAELDERVAVAAECDVVLVTQPPASRELFASVDPAGCRDRRLEVHGWVAVPKPSGVVLAAVALGEVVRVASGDVARSHVGSLPYSSVVAVAKHT